MSKSPTTPPAPTPRVSLAPITDLNEALARIAEELKAWPAHSVSDGKITVRTEDLRRIADEIDTIDDENFLPAAEHDVIMASVAEAMQRGGSHAVTQRDTVETIIGAFRRRADAAQAAA